MPAPSYILTVSSGIGILCVVKFINRLIHGSQPYQSAVARETDLMEVIQMYKNVRDWFTMAAHRARCGRVKKLCPHTGDLKDPVKDLGLTVVSGMSLYQESMASVMEG